MAASTIDHIIAFTVFLSALLLFVGMFNQTLQTAVLFQQHSYLSTKCSDLLDDMLLTPGYPARWGQSDSTPSGFGLQDPEFTQYQLSAFTLMRLKPSNVTTAIYNKTGLKYSNITTSFGNSLFVPYTEAITYSQAGTLLSLNNTFGFQLTMTPVLRVAITENRTNWPTSLNFIISTIRTGFPVSNVTLNYYFLNVTERGTTTTPAYKYYKGTTYTDHRGQAELGFQNVSDSYALIAFANLNGVAGLGYYEHITSNMNYPLPLISSFQTQRIIIAHSCDIHSFSSPAPIFFNATMMILTQNFNLREIPMGNSTGIAGSINYGNGQPYYNLTLPTHANNGTSTFDPSILIITYATSTGYGIVLMPWGLSSMSFPLVFGGTTNNREWVTTDIREVTVGGISYRAELALWSLTAIQPVT